MLQFLMTRFCVASLVMKMPSAITDDDPCKTALLQFRLILESAMEMPLGRLYVPAWNVVVCDTVHPSVGVLPHSTASTG